MGRDNRKLDIDFIKKIVKDPSILDLGDLNLGVIGEGFISNPSGNGYVNTEGIFYGDGTVYVMMSRDGQSEEDTIEKIRKGMKFLRKITKSFVGVVGLYLDEQNKIREIYD